MRVTPTTDCELSFVIPLYDRLSLTQACLRSLRETVRGIEYEVILVDDGSTDGTREFVRELGSPYRIVLNEQNRGFAVSVNRGAHTAQAPRLCLLNNDTVLTAGWLEPMLALLDGSTEIGLVGNIQRNARTRLIDHAGVFFDLHGHPEHIDKGRKRLPRGAHRELNAVSAACCVLRRETFLQFGGFDESFRNGYEDVDICVRLRLAGYRVLASHESTILHHVASAPNRAAHDGANRALFLQRWSAVTAPWGQKEWPRHYLSRHARQWWRYDLRKLVHAMWLVART